MVVFLVYLLLGFVWLWLLSVSYVWLVAATFAVVVWRLSA